MFTAMEDRDAIISRAIEMASEEERDAYIAQACGDDAALRQQVEERVAAHFQARSIPEKPAVILAEAHAESRAGEPAGANHAEVRQVPPTAAHGLWKWARDRSRLLTAVALILLLPLAVVSSSLAAWALRAEGQARTEARIAAEERAQALKDAKAVKLLLDQAEAARQTAAKDRDQELAAEKTAQKSAEDMKAVLAFFQGSVLSAGRPVGWAGGRGKDVTLRAAVDAAESKVGKAFADRPLAEASIREILGSSYLDLGEAALAVKQYERALALREAMLGNDHPDTDICRNQLAVAYRLAGRSDDASRLYD